MQISQPHPQITVYDDVFNWDEQTMLYGRCLHAPYSIGWNDSVFEKESHLHSTITAEMWEHAPKNDSLNDFIEILSNSKPYKLFQHREIDQTVINCDTIADSHTHHIHKHQDVILYYVNKDWKDGWSGETMFYDESGKNIICSLPYTPNRMVIFDGELVHRFNAPSRSAPKFRFSISTFFWKEKTTLDKT